MKRLLRFLVIFVLILILAYLQPVFFSKKVEKEARPPVELASENPHTALPYLELDATGFANYIGKPVTSIKEIYGEPQAIKAAAVGDQWLIYGDTQANYFQILVRNNIITSVFVLGDGDDLSPFEMGMDLADISDITTIFSNFSFTFNEKEYEVELSEEDMNYRPLIAFNNGSFAILQINQETGKLLAVRYLNKEFLLEMMPYELSSGQKLAMPLAPDLNWEEINQSNSEQLLTILNILRERNDFPVYTQNLALKTLAAKQLAEFLEHPERVVEEPKRLNLWQEFRTESNKAQSFPFSKAEYSRLIAPKSAEEVKGILTLPVYDVPWLMLNWYDTPIFQTEFKHQNDREVGISFSKDVVLFLVSEAQTTDSSQPLEDSSTPKE